MLFLPKTPAHPDAGRLNASYLSDDYVVSVNGEDCDVRRCRVSAMPFNRAWPGKQRPIEQSEEASYIHFYADQIVTIRAVCKRTFETAILRPLSKQVAVERNGQELIFTLEEHGAYVLELDDEHHALHIFYDAPRSYPGKENATYYFGPGVHFPGVITLKDNDSVYVDPEAIVFASVFSEGAENVHIFGGGVLDDSCEERITEGCYDGSSKGNIRMYNSRQIVIEDVILLNSANWVLALFDCSDVTIDSIKITGQWRYNTDGIDLTNTSNVSLKNSFVRSFDDTIVIKAIYDHDVCENITVENCVLWCGWGKTLELGLETAATEYRNIHFKNCNLIHNDGGAMAVSNGNYADIHDIYYEDIHVEYQANAMIGQCQHTDEEVYEVKKGAMAHLMRISNQKMWVNYGNLSIADERDKKYGKCHDIIYKNIHVYLEKELPMPVLHFVSESSEAMIERITIDGVFVNGVRMRDISEMKTEFQNIGMIDWK